MDKQLVINAREKTIGDVLFANDIFRIPRYQRSYAWGVDDITEFWNDLIVSEEGTFYLGSLTFNCEELSKTGWIDIIDGQQRLLTITILAAVIRDLIKKLGNDKISDKYQWHCIIISHLKRGEETYRIKCSDSLNEYFQKYIQEVGNDIRESNPRTPEEKRVKNNYIFFFDKLSDRLEQYINKSDKEKYLQQLIETLATLQIIDIRTTSEEHAYEIFETTNARGLELSVGDLLKNTVFKNIGERNGKDIAKELWTDIENNIPSTGTGYGTDMARFLRYYWISKYKFVSQKRLFREIKKEISSWDIFLSDLHSASYDYNKILLSSEYDWSDIKHGEKIHKSLMSLRIMRVIQCHVLLLSILRNYQKLHTNPLKIIQLIEKFSLMYSTICKLPGNQPENIYSRYAIAIENVIQNRNPKKIPGQILKIFEDFKKELIDLKPSFEVFKDYFDDVMYKSSEQGRQLIKYILSEINNLDESGEYKIDFNVVNIEHILPQTPDKAWGLTKNDIKGYVNKLGNLTLLHEKLNSAASSSPISEKIEYFRKSKIPMNQKLVQRLSRTNYAWNEEEIDKRHNELAEIAYNRVWNF